jgi:hypothetical protein
MFLVVLAIFVSQVFGTMALMFHIVAALRRRCYKPIAIITGNTHRPKFPGANGHPPLCSI